MIFVPCMLQMMNALYLLSRQPAGKCYILRDIYAKTKNSQIKHLIFSFRGILLNQSPCDIGR